MEAVPEWLREKSILHIGNIANNAYNAAAYERSLGLKSFAINPDYLHLMSFPFWETDELTAKIEMHFNPFLFITEKNMPDWFLWGNWVEIRKKLDYELIDSAMENSSAEVRTLTKIYKSFLRATLELTLRRFRRTLKTFLPPYLQHWIANALLFNLRKNLSSSIEGIFDQADIICFYGPHNAFAQASKIKKPFISTEHGTIRDYIWSDSKFAQDSKSSYLKSKKILITNQDCYEIAKTKLGISEQDLIKVPHPTSDFDFQLLRQSRIAKMDSDQVQGIIMPTRHSYPNQADRGKGTRVAIEGIALAVRRYPNLQFTLCKYGDDVKKSKILLEKLGLENNISWVPIVSRKLLKLNLINYLAVMDQFETPSYGAITIDAIGLGVPVITAHDFNLDTEFFGTAAPVLPCRDAAGILEQITKLVEEPKLSREVFEKSTTWYDSNVSSKIAFKRRLTAYSSLIGSNS